MKVVALVSGGKDSCFNMMQCVAEGHELVALANLFPQKVDELDSYMFQTVGHHAIELYSQAMGLPLYRAPIKGGSVEQGKDYQPTEGDEVEDLYLLLKKVQDELQVEAVSVGAILSNYQRVRVENVCLRLGLTPLAYLWRRDQSELLQEMIQAQVHAIIIKVAALGLTAKNLGKSLEEIQPHMEIMKTKYQLNVCGEGGEYETFTLDCPLFGKKIVIDSFEVVKHADYDTSPVLYIHFGKMHLADKDKDIEQKTFAERIQDIKMKRSRTLHRDLGIPNIFIDTNDSRIDHFINIAMPDDQDKSLNSGPCFRRGRQGFAWVYGITAESNTRLIESAIPQQTMDAMESLKEQLETNGYALKDAVLIHLYVRNMADFALINSAYCQFFKLNPPARVCVQAALPEDSLLQLDCVAHRPPSLDADGCRGDVQREPAHYRSTMHVQGLSHWAPANIGPYSQAVMIGNLVFCAGIIGLCPSSLAVIEGSIHAQCRLALRSVARVLAAMHCGIGLGDVVAWTCYVTEPGFEAVARKQLQLAMEEEAETQTRDTNCYSMSTPCLVNYVTVPFLPKGCLVEWHVVAATNKQSWQYAREDTCESGLLVQMEMSWCVESGAAAILAKIDIHSDLREIQLEMAVHSLCSAIRAATKDCGFSAANILSFKFFHGQAQIPQDKLSQVFQKEILQGWEDDVPFITIPVLSLPQPTILSACLWLQQEPTNTESAD